MLILSGGAFVHDSQARDALLLGLRSQQLQFREDPATGAWTWLLRQAKVEGEIGQTAGPLAEVAKVMGTPAIRLRAAIPEEWLPGDLASALGRSVGLSAASVTATQPLLERKLKVASAEIKSTAAFVRAARAAKQIEAVGAAGPAAAVAAGARSSTPGPLDVGASFLKEGTVTANGSLKSRRDSGTASATLRAARSSIASARLAAAASFAARQSTAGGGGAGSGAPGLAATPAKGAQLAVAPQIVMGRAALSLSAAISAAKGEADAVKAFKAAQRRQSIADLRRRRVSTAVAAAVAVGAPRTSSARAAGDGAPLYYTRSGGGAAADWRAIIAAAGAAGGDAAGKEGGERGSRDDDALARRALGQWAPRDDSALARRALGKWSPRRHSSGGAAAAAEGAGEQRGRSQQLDGHTEESAAGPDEEARNHDRAAPPEAAAEAGDAPPPSESGAKPPLSLFQQRALKALAASAAGRAAGAPEPVLIKRPPRAFKPPLQARAASAAAAEPRDGAGGDAISQQPSTEMPSSVGIGPRNGRDSASSLLASTSKVGEEGLTAVGATSPVAVLPLLAQAGRVLPSVRDSAGELKHPEDSTSRRAPGASPARRWAALRRVSASAASTAAVAAAQPADRPGRLSWQQAAAAVPRPSSAAAAKLPQATTRSLWRASVAAAAAGGAEDGNAALNAQDGRRRSFNRSSSLSFPSPALPALSFPARAFAAAAAAASAAAAADAEELRLEATARLVSSSLLMAFLFCARVASGESLAEIQRATAELFHRELQQLPPPPSAADKGEGKPAAGQLACGNDYNALVARFRVLLAAGGNLFAKKRWLRRCRAWRLVLLMARPRTRATTCHFFAAEELSRFLARMLNLLPIPPHRRTTGASGTSPPALLSASWPRRFARLTFRT